MTPKPENQSITYPCPAAYQGDWCGGIAALIKDQYECQKCLAVWQLDGTPKPVKDNQ